MRKRRSCYLVGILILLLITSLDTNAQKQSESFSIGKNTFMLNEAPFVIKAAEIHYPRIPEAYWEHRIQMCKS